MIKEIQFEHISIQAHAKKGFIWELMLSKTVDNLPVHMIVKMNRPVVDEDQIRQNVTYRYQEQLKNSLFSEWVRENIEKEVQSEIVMSWKIIRQMPKPIIFWAYLSEYKNGLDQKIKLKVPKDVWLYLFNTGLLVEKLLISVDTYPEYLRGEDEFRKICQEFIESTEDAFNTRDLLTDEKTDDEIHG